MVPLSLLEFDESASIASDLSSKISYNRSPATHGAAVMQVHRRTLKLGSICSIVWHILNTLGEPPFDALCYSDKRLLELLDSCPLPTFPSVFLANKILNAFVQIKLPDVFLKIKVLDVFLQIEPFGAFFQARLLDNFLLRDSKPGRLAVRVNPNGFFSCFSNFCEGLKRALLLVFVKFK